MGIIEELTLATERDFINNLYPHLENSFEEILSNGIGTFKVGEINVNVGKVIRNRTEDEIKFESDDEFEIEPKYNRYISICNENGRGILIYDDQYMDSISILEVFPDVLLSENTIDILNIEEFLDRIDEVSFNVRGYSDSSYNKYPRSLTEKYIVDNLVSNKKDYHSAEDIITFTHPSKNSHHFITPKISDISLLNKSTNLISNISSFISGKQSPLPENYVIKKYNELNEYLRTPVSENISLKFNQIYNIMEEHFKGVREDFSDLNNHISVVELKSYPEKRAIFMETQNRDLIAIEHENGIIDVFKVHYPNAKKSIDSYQFDYDFGLKKGFSENDLARLSIRNGNISDPLNIDNPEYASLEFFIQRYDGSQNLKKEYSTEQNFVLNNVRNENMMMILFSSCQSFLCRYKGIDYDSHQDSYYKSLEFLVDKNLFTFNYKNLDRDKATFDVLFEAHSSDFFHGNLVGNEGTKPPIDYKSINNLKPIPTEKELSRERGYSINSIKYSPIYSDDKINLSNGVLDSYKKCIYKFKESVRENPNLISEPDKFNHVVSQLEDNLKKIEQNQNKVLKSSKFKI